MANVFITGASRGMGRAMAILLAEKDFHVILAARHEADLQRVVEQIKAKGGVASYFVCDVTQEQEVNKTIQTAIVEIGSIEVLINNAGIGLFKPVEEISLDEWQTVMDSNVKSTFLCTKALLPHFKQQQKGHFIVITSDVAKRTFANGTAYCASKFAQDAFAAALRKEVRQYGIKVTTIYPGLTDTNFNGTTEGEERKKDWLRAEDVAQAVLYALNAPPQVVIDEIVLHPKTQDY
jgi:NADP-dependent 3-hydroxy acid dehydrogenase YdfG